MLWLLSDMPSSRYEHLYVLIAWRMKGDEALQPCNHHIVIVRQAVEQWPDIQLEITICLFSDGYRKGRSRVEVVPDHIVSVVIDLHVANTDAPGDDDVTVAVVVFADCFD